MSLHISPEYRAFSCSVIQECFDKAVLYVMPDDGEGPGSNDYTRCALYNIYKKEPDWEAMWEPSEFQKKCSFL